MKTYVAVLRSRLILASMIVLAAGLAACGGGGGGGGGTGTGGPPPPTPTPTPKPVTCLLAHIVKTMASWVAPWPNRPAALSQKIGPGPAVRVCGNALPGQMRCMALKRTDIMSPSVISGYTPTDLQAAYNLPSKTAGFFQTIAIVDAFDDPKAESDMGVYRTQFALPACTTANGCFLKVNQNGALSPLPATDPTPCGSPGCWEDEESLDLDMASAVCPNCHILLVEADGPGGTGQLYTAVDSAATKCAATEISNSWNGGEYAGETGDDVHFDRPGIPITFASGDGGYPAGGYPTASQFVTAVGGTTLNNPGKGTQSETVWGGTGSLCSAYVSQPSWQSSLAVVLANPTVCTMRINNDVAAVGDPNTGVAVYSTYKEPGWLVFGGTSVATPIIAGVYALAGNGGSIVDGSYSYSHTTALHDVTIGNNEPCGPPPVLVGSYVCNAQAGYDGPTGNGTPNGTGAF